MNLDPGFLLANRQEVLKIVLKGCTPAEILKDEELFSSFAECMSQGTTEEIDQLQRKVLSTLHPSSSVARKNHAHALSSCAISDSSVRQTPSLDATLQWQVVTCSPPALPSPPSSPPSSSNPNWNALAQTFLVQQRVGNSKYIIQVLNGFRCPQFEILKGFLQIWSPRKETCDSSPGVDLIRRPDGGLQDPDALQTWSTPDRGCSPLDDGLQDTREENQFLAVFSQSWSRRFPSRIQRLNKDLQKVEIRKTCSEFTLRLLRLFYAHEIDEILRLPQVESHPLQPGQGRLSLAFKIMATITGTQTEDVRALYGIGKKYKKLLRKCGSGTFLFIPSGDSSTWDHHVRLSDIDQICTLRKTYLPVIEKDSHQQDKLARGIIIEGLLQNYGWTRDDLNKTELMQVLIEEEKSENKTNSHGVTRSNGDRYEEFSPVQEIHACLQQHEPQSEPPSKRQKRSNPQLSNYSQVPRQTFSEEANISIGMAPSPVDCPSVNDEVSDLEAAQILPEEGTSALDSQQLIIKDIEVRSISLDGNMQDVSYGRNEASDAIGQAESNNSNVPNEDKASKEVSQEESEEDDMSDEGGEDLFGMNFDWYAWASASSG